LKFKEQQDWDRATCNEIGTKLEEFMITLFVESKNRSKYESKYNFIFTEETKLNLYTKYRKIAMSDKKVPNLTGKILLGNKNKKAKQPTIEINEQ
jgi:hypothetical protein